MSRNVQYVTGARPAPPNPALWTFQTKVVFIPNTTGTPTIPLYLPPGPLLAEWFQVEADLRNTTYALFGQKNLGLVPPTGPTFQFSIQAMTTLGPGEGLIFEPNDKGDNQDGFITGPEVVAALAMTPDLDFIDVTQFYVQPSAPNVALSFHCTIGNRSRR